MQNQTLLDVRYYGEVIHPSRFRGKGWKGRVILALNWLRYKLETYIQYRILRLGMEIPGEAAVDRKERSKVVENFWRDVKKEQLLSELSDPGLEPSLPGSQVPFEVPSRQQRYVMSRREKVVSEGVEELPSPLPLDNLIARLGSHGRDQRYGRGMVIMEEHLSGLEEDDNGRKD